MENRLHPALESIEVSLHLDSEPHVRLSAPHADVFGAQKIRWTIAPHSPIKDFYFLRESVHFISNAACFIRPKTHARERAFSIYNTYTLVGDCCYILMVEHNGKYYTTVTKGCLPAGDPGDPMIHNR